MILADAAPYYCFKDGHAGQLVTVCKEWYELINLPVFGHPFYITPVNMEHYCLFNIYKTLKLAYKPNKDDNDGMKEISLSDSMNSSGEFDSFNIIECGDADQYLRITPDIRR